MHRTWNMSIAKMNQPEIEGWQMPLRHHLRKLSPARQRRLNHRRKFADTRSSKDRRSKTSVVVHRKKRLESECLPVSSIRMNEAPLILRPAERECEKAVFQQVLRRSWRLVLLQISRAREQLMPVGQQLSANKAGVLKNADAERKVHALRDVIDDAFGDKHLAADPWKRLLKCSNQRCQQRVRNTRGSRNAQRSGNLRKMIGRNVSNGLAHLRAPLRVLQNLRANIGQTQTARGALQKPNPKFILKLGNAAADSGRRHPQASRGLRKTVRLNHLCKDDQCVQVSHAKNYPKFRKYICR